MSFPCFFLRAKSFLVILGAAFVCPSRARATPIRRQTVFFLPTKSPASSLLRSTSVLVIVNRPKFSIGLAVVVLLLLQKPYYITKNGLINVLISELRCKSHSQPIAAGGDGIDVQFWYVGIDPTLQVNTTTIHVTIAPFQICKFQTVVVAYQGTDPSKV